MYSDRASSKREKGNTSTCAVLIFASLYSPPNPAASNRCSACIPVPEPVKNILVIPVLCSINPPFIIRHYRLINLSSYSPGLEHLAGHTAATTEIRRGQLQAPVLTSPAISLHHPFVPDTLVIRLSPHADLELRVIRVMKGSLGNQVLATYRTVQYRVLIATKLTFNGKNMGNHEIMSLLFSSILSGCVLISTLTSLPSSLHSNNVDSKYPASP